jgi:hypothetical protein
MATVADLFKHAESVSKSNPAEAENIYKQILSSASGPPLPLPSPQKR